jgi:hypothetical protein
MSALFTLQIAGLRVTVDCHHRKLASVFRRRYRGFLAPDGLPPDLYADVRWVGTARENALLETGLRFENGVLHFTAAGYTGQIDAAQGRGELALSSKQPVEEIDYYLRVIYALLAHKAGGVLLHAAGMARTGEAYLFLGPSGVGKTKLCRVSQPLAEVLNDDLILLLPRGDSWQACSTPFWNPTQVPPVPASAPLRAMFKLRQSEQVLLCPMGAGQALAALAAGAPVIPEDPTRVPRLLETLAALQRAAPMYELHFRPDASFWALLENGKLPQRQPPF